MKVHVPGDTIWVTCRFKHTHGRAGVIRAMFIAEIKGYVVTSIDAVFEGATKDKVEPVLKKAREEFVDKNETGLVVFPAADCFNTKNEAEQALQDPSINSKDFGSSHSINTIFKPGDIFWSIVRDPDIYKPLFSVQAMFVSEVSDYAFAITKFVNGASFDATLEESYNKFSDSFHCFLAMYPVDECFHNKAEADAAIVRDLAKNDY